MQNTNTILMIRPVRFDLNEQTVASNAFQQRERTESGDAIQKAARAEFDQFVKRLKKEGVQVIVFDDTLEPATPDSIFPNNWVSFHQDATVYLYPMQALNRRLERRMDIIKGLQARGFSVKNIRDTSNSEADNMFLEGTGSMVLDRTNRKVYACLSPRTHPQLLDKWCAEMNYTPIVFHAHDANGQEIYHTNVVMCVADGYAVVCMEAVRDAQERENIEQALEETGHEIVEISLDQMNRFAGNMLQVRTDKDIPLLVMSEQAYDALDIGQVFVIQSYNPILSSPIPTIERYGGGSARCMMAEVFLPRA